MNNDIEIINEDIDEISPEAVAEGDYFMRCLKEGKDPFETKALNEAAMEANQKIINESAGDPVPMVGMQQPIIVTKMYKNIYNQDDSKIYIANNYKFDTIFEPDGIGTALECSLANSTLTADDLKSENTKIVDITQEQYDSFVELTKEGYTFNEALEEVFFLDESTISDKENAVLSQMIGLYTHILKWDYQPSKRYEGWTTTINNVINNIHKITKKDEKTIIKRLQNNKEKLQYPYKEAYKKASNEVKPKGFDTEPPKEIPDRYADIYSLIDKEKISEYLKDKNDRFGTNYLVDEKIK